MDLSARVLCTLPVLVDALVGTSALLPIVEGASLSDSDSAHDLVSGAADGLQRAQWKLKGARKTV